MYFKPSWISKSARVHCSYYNVVGKNERPILTIKSPKNCIFPKGLTHAFGAKNVNFFLYLFSVKIRLVIVLLNDFVEKKETFLSIKKTECFQSPKTRIFQKGLTHAFDKKIPISSLFRFGQNKTRKNALRLCREKSITQCLCRKKRKPFLTIKNRIFQSPKNRIFFRRG